MNFDDPFDQNIDWSAVPLPNDNAAASSSRSTPSTNAIPHSFHSNKEDASMNHNHHHHHNDNNGTGSIQNNTSITTLQTRLSQLETMLAEKDSRLFDLESSIAALEAETQFSIQSANQSQLMIQTKEEELRRMQQMIEKKNMVIVRLQKKRGREGSTNHDNQAATATATTTSAAATTSTTTSSSSPVSGFPEYEDRVEVLPKEKQQEQQQEQIHFQNTSIGVQTDENSSNDMDRSTNRRPTPHQNAWRIISCLPSIQSLHLNFSSHEKLTIPQLCRLVLSRIYSHYDLKLMIALYDLCSASSDARDCIRCAFDAEGRTLGLSSEMNSMTRIRGLTPSTRNVEDCSDMVKGRLGHMLMIFIVGKKSMSEEDVHIDNKDKDELRIISLKIILVLMHNAPHESGIWSFGISFMDEYFSDFLKILEQTTPSQSLDYMQKHFIIDIMAFTIEYKADRVASFFFQETRSMERLLLAFTNDVKRELSQSDALTVDPESYGLQYLLSLMGLFVLLVQIKDGFDLVRAQVNYTDNQYASCIGMAFATMDKELHLLEKNSHAIHISKDLQYQIVRRCVDFFYRLNVFCESMSSDKRPVSLIDILQEADITHRLVFCFRTVIRFKHRHKTTDNELFDEKTRAQATTLLESIQKGLKHIQGT